MSSLKLLAPAKINLCLRILGRREDGYHDLSMVMEKINLCDEITLKKIPKEIELVHGPRSTVHGPVIQNLTHRAAALLQKVSGTYCGVRITLTKKIPMGGGLGGGSSDAATVLKGLNELWGLHWPTPKLAELGLQLGADVPFFVSDGPSKVEGIGDKITPLRDLPNLSIILINPGVSVSTPWAYQAWDKPRSPRKASDAFEGGQKNLTQENQNVRDSSTFEGVIQILHNDFEAVVIPEYPEIQKAKEALVKVGAKGVLMSGSGSTVFGLFETKKGRDRALEKIEEKPAWQIFAVENWGVDKR